MSENRKDNTGRHAAREGGSGSGTAGGSGRSRSRKRRSRRSRVRRFAENVIILCLAGVMLVAGYNVYKILHDYNTNQNIYDVIAETAGPEEKKDGFTGDIDFDALRAINPDIKAWLYYEGTMIDYPIVQGSDNKKYLKTMFDGTYSGFGTLFVDAGTLDAFRQFNTIVYGHHMLNGSMFGDLKKLKEEEYCVKHPQMELITPEGKYHLMICAFLNQPSDSDIYRLNITEETDRQDYIDLIRRLSLYLTDQEMTADDRLVVLSTCAYEYQDARYMVIGRMVPWEEEAAD